MNSVLPPRAAISARPAAGTNAAIEQPFAPMAAAHRPPRPNLLVVHACDLGSAEIGAYGGTHAETPSLDRLALSGVRFTDAYADPVGGPPDPDLTEVLGRHGYASETFGAGARADLAADATAAATFIGVRRPVPWAAYVRLRASPAAAEPLPSVLSYVDAVTGLDSGVGALVAALRRTDQYRSTLVLVVGARERDRLVPGRGREPEGAGSESVPTLLSWPGQLPPRQRHGRPVLTSDWVPTLLALAQVPDGYDGQYDGVDLSGHLLDGGDVPARRARVRAA